jgi:hypothetical protein
MILRLCGDTRELSEILQQIEGEEESDRKRRKAAASATDSAEQRLFSDSLGNDTPSTYTPSPFDTSSFIDTASTELSSHNDPTFGDPQAWDYEGQTNEGGPEHDDIDLDSIGSRFRFQNLAVNGWMQPDPTLPEDPKMLGEAWKQNTSCGNGT